MANIPGVLHYFVGRIRAGGLNYCQRLNLFLATTLGQYQMAHEDHSINRLGLLIAKKHENCLTLREVKMQ